MMHLEYKTQDYKGCRIDIQPDRATDIPRLRNMLINNMMVENPAKTFARKMKAGGFDGMNEDKVEAQARVVNELSELWDGVAEMNVLMLLSRAMQTIVNLSFEVDPLIEEYFVDDFEEDPFDPNDCEVIEDDPDDYVILGDDSE